MFSDLFVLLSEPWCMAAMVFISFIYMHHSVIVVRPGQRAIAWKRFGKQAGRIRVLESGTHFLDAVTWSIFGQGPFKELLKIHKWKNVCPVPFSTLFLDPDRVEIMSSDKIPGTANVALEVQILEWSASEIISIAVPFKQRASITVNQWVSKQLSKLDASTLLSYAEVVSCLNDPDNLAILNAQLKDCFMEAKRVSVDPNGIRLNEDYYKTVGKAIQNTRNIELQRLEMQVNQEAAERKLKLQLLETQSQCENSKLKADTDYMIEKKKTESLAGKVIALAEAGLTPVQISNIIVAEVSVTGLTKAQKVVVGMPHGLIGLRGVDQVHGDTQSHDVYEKV